MTAPSHPFTTATSSGRVRPETHQRTQKDNTDQRCRINIRLHPCRLISLHVLFSLPWSLKVANDPRGVTGFLLKSKNTSAMGFWMFLAISFSRFICFISFRFYTHLLFLSTPSDLRTFQHDRRSKAPAMPSCGRCRPPVGTWRHSWDT